MDTMTQDILDPAFTLCRYNGEGNPRPFLSGHPVCCFVFYPSKNSSFCIESFSLIETIPETLPAKDGSGLLRHPALVLTIDRENFFNYLNLAGIHESFPQFEITERLQILTREQSDVFVHLFRKLYAWYRENPDSLRLLKYSWLYEVLLAIRRVHQKTGAEGRADLKDSEISETELTAEASECVPAASSGNAARQTIGRIIPYIQEHYTEPLTVDTISELFFISKYHLMREFKRYTGSTIHTYILNKRIARAQTMISHGMNAGEVSNIVGFSDYSLFYRAFIKVTGMTPKEYGNRVRPGDGRKNTGTAAGAACQIS